MRRRSHGEVAMNRIVFWLLATVTVVVLLFGYHTSTSGPDASAVPPAVISAPTATSPAPSSGSSSTPSSTPSPSAAASPSGASTRSAATTVTGTVEDTQRGPVQVELSIAGGAISDVRVVQYPHGNGRDLQINTFALPRLVKETLAAQSAQIDMVSGATITSDGYVRSLQSALDRAGL
jgi:uncharacterized protein with FMN-binding domain